MSTTPHDPAPHAHAGRPEVTLSTRSGIAIRVRPVRPTDEADLRALLEHITSDDLRFRFLSAVPHVGDAQIAAMLSVDHVTSENFLAFESDSGKLVATAMIAADAELSTAEVAISIHRDYKGKGIGWSLLDYTAKCARERGIGKLQSIESHDNRAAIELEREMGFTTRPYPGDPTLTLVEISLK
ncbi:GNAT family N-acetyltransferase [Sphingomonas sp. C3-2]|uniref:GNAT family N-acetyltransferase n=1 Tax=Sphingomonas sp. C3-2 TaxID=3062169 RepID=UPI00294B430A|nr:GNAT family N-acetyltransferase [Sphingomonas sp. C3-2]WOK35991.1 GNAT family N-acetyltransferase [Sphingomonas sp. C3-2]